MLEIIESLAVITGGTRLCGHVGGDIYKNEALNGEVFFIHGGLRLGSNPHFSRAFSLQTQLYDFIY